MAKIVVINTKGGVGKSTFSSQVLGPYLYLREGSATVVEVDDQNHDASDYSNSEISFQQEVVGDTPQRSVDRLAKNFYGEHVVIDVGGNRTAETFIRLAGPSGLLSTVDLIVIPVSQTGKDVENAQRTLDLIREHCPMYAGQIVLGATRLLDVAAQEDLEYDLPDAMDFIKDNHLAGSIRLPASEVFATSRMWNTTVWELSDIAVSSREMLMNSLNDARRDKNDEQMLYWSRRMRTSENALKMRSVLEAIFEEIDDLITRPANAPADEVETVEEAEVSSGE